MTGYTAKKSCQVTCDMWQEIWSPSPVCPSCPSSHARWHETMDVWQVTCDNGYVTGDMWQERQEWQEDSYSYARWQVTMDMWQGWQEWQDSHLYVPHVPHLSGLLLLPRPCIAPLSPSSPPPAVLEVALQQKTIREQISKLQIWKKYSREIC